MKTAAIYTRSSAGDPMSNARQERACRAYCKSQEWKAGPTFSDLVTGTGKRRRPGWAALTKAVEAGEVEVVVVYSLSRAARNLLDLLQFKKLCDERGVLLDSVSEPIGGDYGPVFVAILGALAELEAKSKSDRAKLKRAELVDAGKWGGGRRLFGFRPVPADDGGWRLTVEPVEAEAIQLGAEMLLNGASLKSLLDDWNGRGLRTSSGNAWTKAALAMLLKNPKLVPTILTQRDWNRVQDVYRERATGRRTSRYLLTGLLECGICGRRLTGRGGRYICLGPDDRVHLAVRMDRVDSAVVDRADERPQPNLRRVADPAKLSRSLLAKREALEARLAKAGEDFADERISEAAFRGLDRRLRAKVREVDEQLEQAAAEAERTSPVRDWIARGMPDPDPQDRVWLETLIAKVVVAPSKRGANRFDPARLTISWR